MRAHLTRRKQAALHDGRCTEGYFFFRWWHAGEEERPWEVAAEHFQQWLMPSWKSVADLELFSAPDYTPGKRSRGCCPFCGGMAHSYRVVRDGGGSVDFGEYLAAVCGKCGGRDAYCSFCAEKRRGAHCFVRCENVRCFGTGPAGYGREEAWVLWNGGTEGASFQAQDSSNS